MFQSPTGLPHLLAPSAYYDTRFAQCEIERVLKPAWHVVGTTNQFARPGDFLTVELFGIPVIVRRFEKEIVALSNVCAHRHSLITSCQHGNSAALKCQYHGWEYGQDGYTRRIPCAKDLAPIDREQFRLARYQLATCGQLVFVCLGEPDLSLADYLGPLHDKLSHRTGESNSLFFQWSVKYESNWKVAIENSLEAYHVQQVHPETFRTDPGEERSEHILESRHTAFGTNLPFAESKFDVWFLRAQRLVLRRLGIQPGQRYWQHHVFPNLLCSFTDGICLVHSVFPMGPTAAYSTMLQFGPCPQRGWRRLLALAWGKLEAACTKRIVKEDVEMYPRIQRGLNASYHRGRLARSEERIHRFQLHLADRLGAEAPGQFVTSNHTM